jgi:hypothetical protein
MKAGTYGIKNLQRILPHIIDWTNIPYQDFSELKEIFSAVFSQYGLYLGHVIKNIGGVENTYKIASVPGPVYVPTAYDRQKKAMQFLDDQLFNTPLWLNEKNILSKLPNSFGVELSNIQKNTLDALITRRRMNNLLNTQYESKVKAYTLNEMFKDMDHDILTELYAGKNVDFYRRNLQKIYVNRLIEEGFATDNPNDIVYGYHHYLSDIQGILKNTLKEQEKLFKKALQNPNLDQMTKIHLRELDEKITSRFNDNTKASKAIPPAPVVQ